jgi:hypothetical protein
MDCKRRGFAFTVMAVTVRGPVGDRMVNQKGKRRLEGVTKAFSPVTGL